MNLEGHLESLRGQHATLEAQIRDEDHRPAPDTDRMAVLKRHKLKIKEAITRAEQSLGDPARR